MKEPPTKPGSGTAVTLPGAEEDPARRTIQAPTHPRDPLTGLDQTLDDFELVRLLGAGSFARVYLARQVSLGRLVALKISRNLGQEARTLAPLEHDHIVRVFSEVVDPARDLRFLCMQYVSGTTLQRIIDELHSRPALQRQGRAVLEIIDQDAIEPAALDLSAMRECAALAEMTLVEVGCWMGARLAEALTHAHEKGVLHRDIKPANILVNRYGRPLLADFNIAANTRGSESNGGLGGTLPYMPPEHLDAFNPDDFTPVEAVDSRSDIWSLGAVLYELLTGRLPYPMPPLEGRPPDILRHLSEQRCQPPPRLAPEVSVPPALERVLARCLAPRPRDRYSDAEELAADLDSCLESCRVQRDLPAGGWLTALCLRAPFLVGAILVLLPHLAGSVINISYNGLRIVGQLTSEQQDLFPRLVLFYNLVAYPLCLVILYFRIHPVWAAWRQLTRFATAQVNQTEPILPDAVEKARKQALNLPVLAVQLACLGWLPGGVLFPLVLNLATGDLESHVFGHFIYSFTISGLVATTYSVLVVEFIVIRVLYPGLWLEAREMRPTAQRELRGVEGRLAVLQFCAVLIPLAGAVLMVSVGPEAFAGASYHAFRLLVTTLLGAGMVGLGLTLVGGHQLRQTLGVLMGLARRR